MGKIIYITGGSSSGKSVYAESLCKKYSSVAYIATGVETDEEMSRRIARHRARRNSNWRTLEASTEVYRAVMDVSEEAALIDSVSTLISNIIYSNSSADGPTREQAAQIEAMVSEELGRLINAIVASGSSFIIVTDEVGMGMVSFNPQGRLFCDLLGRANQALAQISDEAYVIVSGMPIKLK